MEMLREYLEEDEDRSILISSHISNVLESLCDDIYMIHEGEIVLHENTDVLLSYYAENFPETVIENGSIDGAMAMIIRGGTQL